MPTYLPRMETRNYLMVWRQYETFLNSNWRAISKLIFHLKALEKQYHHTPCRWSHHWLKSYIRRNRIYINSRQVCSYWKKVKVNWLSIFALILTETNCWELLGKQHSIFPSISKTAKCSTCQWVISHCEGSLCLYCRQTLGWPHQFLEHRPCCQSQIPALLSYAPHQQSVLCSWNLPTHTGQEDLPAQCYRSPWDEHLALPTMFVLCTLLTEANCKSTTPLQPNTHDCSCHRWLLL